MYPNRTDRVNTPDGCPECPEVVRRMADNVEETTLSVFASCDVCHAKWDLVSNRF